jgi:hypothetical protein
MKIKSSKSKVGERNFLLASISATKIINIGIKLFHLMRGVHNRGILYSMLVNQEEFE